MLSRCTLHVVSQQQKPQTDDDFDRQVGQNVRDLRTAMGMTQGDVVQELRARGLELAQQTIVKIEQGSRPLRLQEADLLADVLGVDVDALVSPAVTLPAAVMYAATRVREAWEGIGHDVQVLERHQQELRDLLAGLDTFGDAALPPALREAAEAALLLTPTDFIDPVPSKPKGRRRGR